MRVDSGVTILECKDIQGASGQGVCHDQCHHDGRLIHFTPRALDGTRDYFLKVEAEVCCTMWHVVFNLPRSFWESASKETQKGRTDWFGSFEAASPTTGQRRRVSKPARRIVQPNEKLCLICGEPSEEDVCEKCL